MSADEDPGARLRHKAASEAGRKARESREARELGKVAAQKAQLAARERLHNPDPEVERMREVGRAFALAMRTMPWPEGLLYGIWPRRFEADYKRKQRGWLIEKVYGVPGGHGGRTVVVLKDGRVGHPGWMKPGHIAPYRSEWLPWHDLPWSERLEDELAKWLASHHVVGKPRSQ